MNRLASISTTAALTISLLYFSFGMAWIELSDLALFSMFDDLTGEEVTQMQTYKGFFFIGITSLILFIMSKRQLTRINKLEKEKLQQREELDALFDNELFGVAKIDLKGNIEKANVTMRRLLQLQTTDGFPPLLYLKFKDDNIVSEETWKDLLAGELAEYMDRVGEGIIPSLSVHLKAVRNAQYEPKYFVLILG